MLFQLEERHVQEIHRLVQARVHPELLPLGDAELALQWSVASERVNRGLQGEQALPYAIFAPNAGPTLPQGRNPVNTP
jgi:hypothetical protein